MTGDDSHGTGTDRGEATAASGIRHPKMPTAKQLAEAADIATRFAEASIRDDEETYAALRRAAFAMGTAALARTARGER